MGGVNSTNNVQVNVNHVIARTLTRMVNSKIDQSGGSQSITLVCDNNARKMQTTCWSDCLLSVEGLAQPEYAEQYRKCKSTCLGCDWSHIDQSQTAVFVDKDKLFSGNTVDVANAMATAMKSTLEQDNGLFTFGDSVNNSIDNVCNILSDNKSSIRNAMESQFKANQVINIIGGHANYLHQNQMLRAISDATAHLTSLTKAKNSLATAIEAESSQTAGLTLGMIIWIVIGIIAILIIYALIKGVAGGHGGGGSSSTIIHDEQQHGGGEAPVVNNWVLAKAPADLNAVSQRAGLPQGGDQHNLL